MTRLGRRSASAVPLLAVAAMTLARVHVPAQGRGVDPVTTDVQALEADGRPVRDLKPEDLTVKMDGKTRTLRSLQLVPVGDAPGSGVRSGAVDVPPPFDTNVLSRVGRGIMLVVDNESLPVGGERPIKQAIAQMASELSPTDRVAVATVPHGGLQLDFTTDRAGLQQALAPVVGQSRNAMTDQEASCQTRMVLEQTIGILNGLDPAAGPTVFILFSGWLVGPRSDTFRAGQQVGSCELTPDNFQQLGNAAAEARTEFYLVQPEHDSSPAGGSVSTALFGGNRNPQVGLENVAGVTGGQLLHLASGGDNILTRIARETSAHYLLTFDIDPADRSVPGHRLEVRTSRAGVGLRARPLVMMPKGDAAKGAPAKTARETLRDVRAYRDLPLRSTSFFARGADQKLTVGALVEPLDPAVTLTSVVAGLYAGSKLVSEWVSKPEDLAILPVKAGLLAAPGAYRLRVAASDTAGHVGVVDASLNTELAAAGSLKLSSLVLGVPNAAGAFVPRLSFSSEPMAMVYFELYGGRANMQIGASIELAASVNGPALATAPPKWGGTSEADRFSGTAQIPIDGLPPGDYVVRAIVGLDGQPEGRILRTLRKR